MRFEPEIADSDLGLTDTITLTYADSLKLVKFLTHEAADGKYINFIHLQKKKWQIISVNPQSSDGCEATPEDIESVSYTHLTLPTKA